jgi:hypothetical protein
MINSKCFDYSVQCTVFVNSVTTVLTSLVYGCHVSQWLTRGFGLVVRLINNLQVVTTINYYTIAALHNVHLLHTNLFNLSALVFTGL